MSPNLRPTVRPNDTQVLVKTKVFGEGQRLFQKEGRACLDLTTTRCRLHSKNRMFTKPSSYSIHRMRQGRPHKWVEC